MKVLHIRRQDRRCIPTQSTMSSGPISGSEPWTSGLPTASTTFPWHNSGIHAPSRYCAVSVPTPAYPLDVKMPPHWINSYPRWPRLDPFLRAVFATLCFIGIGRPDLTDKWRGVSAREDHVFREHVQRIAGNLSSFNLMVVSIS